MNVSILGVSGDDIKSVLAMEVSQKITFPLVSNEKLVSTLGLSNPNMNRAPIVVLVGKNMVKYWVYEGISVSDRPDIEVIKDQVSRVSKIY